MKTRSKLKCVMTVGGVWSDVHGAGSSCSVSRRVDATAASSLQPQPALGQDRAVSDHVYVIHFFIAQHAATF